MGLNGRLVTKAISTCLVAVALAGCGSLPTGPLALSDSGGFGTVQHTVPNILPARKPLDRMASHGSLKTIWSGHSADVLALTSQEEPEPELNFISDVNDPLQPVGRISHKFNRGVDFVIMRPVAGIYNTLIPKPVRGAVKNGLRHLRLPSQFVNYLLQGEGEQAAHTLERLMVNTIIGFVGLADPASKRAEMAYKPTDFGITLGKWGVGEGMYFEAPLFGPATTRSTVGTIVEIAFNPLTYLTFATNVGEFTAVNAIGPSVLALRLIDKRARNADLIDEILYASPDTYITLRTVYLQDRRNKLTGGEITEETLPTILEFVADR